jgi:hypothetical protein
MNKKKEYYLENLNRMKEIEQIDNNRIKKPLTEERIKHLIKVYEDEVNWLIEVDSFPTKTRKELGFDNRRELENKLSQFKMVVIVLYDLINTPPYLIPYSKEYGEYSFCEFIVKQYSEEKSKHQTTNQ